MIALAQDLRADMVSIGKVSGEERTERPEAVVESLAHVPDGLFVPFGQGRAGGVHEHVVESCLHGYGSLLPRCADEATDRGVLHSGLLQVCLKSLEVLVGRLRDGAEIFGEAAAVLLKEGLRALEHRELAHNVGKDRCIEGCLPSAVGPRFVSLAERIRQPPPAAWRPWVHRGHHATEVQRSTVATPGARLRDWLLPFVRKTLSFGPTGVSKSFMARLKSKPTQ